MAFGIPCTDDPQPQDVYAAFEAIDALISSVVQAIYTELSTAQSTLDFALQQSYDTLKRSIDIRLSQIDKQITLVTQAVYDELTSLTSITDSHTAEALTKIATTLQTDTQSVIESSIEQLLAPPANTGLSGEYVPFPSGAVSPAPPIYGPPGSPFIPQLPQVPPYVPQTPFPPSTIPSTPAPPKPPAVPPASTNIVVGGATVPVQSVCMPQAAGLPVTAGGITYQPVVSVWVQQRLIDIGGDGNPYMPVYADTQPDGTLVVSIGPISVAFALPSADPKAQGAQCQIDFNPNVNPITGQPIGG